MQAGQGRAGTSDRVSEYDLRSRRLDCEHPVMRRCPNLYLISAFPLLPPVSQVREEMVGAGQAIVDSHGSTHAPRLLPLFESFLERGAGAATGLDEGQYDLVGKRKGGGMESPILSCLLSVVSMLPSTMSGSSDSCGCLSLHEPQRGCQGCMQGHKGVTDGS
jgi:hypothetical protein